MPANQSNQIKAGMHIYPNNIAINRFSLIIYLHLIAKNTIVAFFVRHPV
jgi:hypothetical protein